MLAQILLTIYIRNEDVYEASGFFDWVLNFHGHLGIIMKLYKRIKMGWMGLLPALAITLGLAAAPLAQAGISGTKHNLSTSGTASNKMTAPAIAAAEICVFCHTPHGASTTNKAPLWNKGSTGSTYTTYSSASSSTIDGTVSLSTSVSLGCLSCHDGAQAMDNMINAPGSGGYNAAGASLVGAVWVGAATMPAGIANLGSDLTNDHPVAIQYCGGGLTGATTTVSGTCGDTDFKNGSTDVKTKNVGGTQVFWVDTGTPASRQKTDLPLYANSGVTGPTVECATCHDPHSDAQLTFLRISNAASAVCLTCHVK